VCYPPDVSEAVRRRGNLCWPVLCGVLVGLASCSGQSRSTSNGRSGGAGAGSDRPSGVTSGDDGAGAVDTGGAAGAPEPSGGSAAGGGAVAGSLTSGSGGWHEGGSGGDGAREAGGAIGVSELVGALDGRRIQIPCSDYTNFDDCSTIGYDVDGVLTPCEFGRVEMSLDHPIGGTPGTTYLATLHFYGILEPKNYGPDVARQSGSTPPENLATGAEPAPWAVAAPGVQILPSNYNSYEIRVFDQATNEVGVYFVNSDTMEGRYTYVIDYEQTIPVIGGGIVRLAMHSRDCRHVKNCGDGGGTCAEKTRLVDISSVDPQPRVDFSQPDLGRGPGNAGQWWMIDVTHVAHE
jgi:hypothetical protein